MKSYAIFLFFIFGCVALMFSQDLLVTHRGDSLNCEVGTCQKGIYSIIFLKDGQRMSGTIPKDSVLYFQRKKYRSLYSNSLKPWYSTVEVGLDFGMAHQIGAFQKEYDLTTKNSFQARSGFYIGGDLSYFVSKTIGYGIKYHLRSLLEGDLVYQYVGPTMQFRFWDAKKRNNLFLMVSAGYGQMVQKDAPIQLGLNRVRIDMSAKTFASDISIGGNFRLSKVISLRTKLSGTIGYPKFRRVKDIQKYVVSSDQSLHLGTYCNNMNTINLSVGFTLNK